jgi:hypothetical protein
MPLVFAASASSAASGVGLLFAPPKEVAPVQRLAAVASASELVLLQRMTRGMDPVIRRAYERGRAGRLLKASESLTVLGAAGTVIGRKSRIVTRLSGAALVAASACGRFAIFEAGRQSAADPQATLGPQRARFERSK